jgi:hypothetical protein
MTVALVAALGLTAAVTAGCGSSSTPASSGGAAATTQPAKRILPVTGNPISRSGTASGLGITKVLVENNVSPDTGKAVDDHLEVVLENTSDKPLDQLELYYKISDPAKKLSEGYYTKLDGVTIPAGASRTVNFDNTGAKDHFPVNRFSLYYTDKNALVVDVTASSPDLKPATFTAKKDSAGAEAGVE